jgi:hypothetical protein
MPSPARCVCDRLPKEGCRRAAVARLVRFWRRLPFSLTHGPCPVIRLRLQTRVSPLEQPEFHRAHVNSETAPVLRPDRPIGAESALSLPGGYVYHRIAAVISEISTSDTLLRRELSRAKG